MNRPGPARRPGLGADRRRDERGSGLVEFIWMGVILLIPLVWIVVSVFTVQRGAFATSGAARAAGRAYVLAPTDGIGHARAVAAARQVFRDQGIGGQPFSLHVSCRPFPHQCHSGTSIVTVSIHSRVDLPLLPSILGGGAPTFKVDAAHTVPVGQYQEIRRASQ